MIRFELYILVRHEIKKVKREVIFTYYNNKKKKKKTKLKLINTISEFQAD